MEHHNHFGKGFFAGLLAGAVGGILLYKKKRSLSGIWWKMRVRADMYRRLRDFKRLSKSTYEDIVDSVLAKYGVAGAVAAYQLEELGDILKSEWEEVKRRFNEARDKTDDRKDEDETSF